MVGGRTFPKFKDGLENTHPFVVGSLFWECHLLKTLCCGRYSMRGLVGG